MKIDIEGRKFIYLQEGVRLKAYLDCVGVPTIGVGFTYVPGGKKVKLGDVITQSQCDNMFTAIAASYEDAVNRLVKAGLNQHQFNALVSFSFNCGTEALEDSSLLKAINAGADESTIRADFAKWNKAGGKVNKVLTERRKDEADLFFKK